MEKLNNAVLEKDFIKDKIFRTSNIALATMICTSFPLEDVNWEEPRYPQFKFERSPKLERFVTRYRQGRLRIEPQRFFNKLNIVKGILQFDQFRFGIK
ncbi:MAG: DUF5659 domain-containing protein [Candidatus Ratteibacteria bacterium]|jgi:hypothetical protein